MGILSGIGGLVGGLSGLFGGGSNQPPAPNTFQLPNMGGAANAMFGGIQGLSPYTNLGQFGLGAGQGIYNTMANNPFGGMYQGGAGVASGLGMSGALNQFNQGQGLAGAGFNMLPGAQTIFNTGMDPQNALYNRTLQQLTDQSRAGLEARGLNMTPYGAGVEGQTLGNFNIDWQNNLLQRQIAGAQGAGGLLGSAGNAISQGSSLAAAAPGQFLGASAMPYGVFNQLGNDQYANLNQLLGIGGSGLGLAQGQIGDWGNYLGIGSQMDANAISNYQAQLQAQRQQFQENQIFGGQIGQALYGLGRSPLGQYGLGGSSPFGYNPSAFGGQGSLFGYSLNPSFSWG